MSLRSIFIIFIFPFLVGFFCPYIFIKSASKWKKWIPAFIFFIATIFLGTLSQLVTSGFDDLGYMILAMETGTATIGSILGALFIKYKIAKRDKALESHKD